ncbi:transcriptional regulator [Streptomyces sp. TRM66268-LWL]|uniref:Transcriptional regulator n=1 Tax=Streptomyces polyasparticus TaxID=2767826 RepID=A0ABR7SR90_9ACTN|nr:transcriptional regulator [Streptomyces polyasparticus]MBC9717404.1 transcriptional regulator [Streptomyces polyasparticus]
MSPAAAIPELPTRASMLLRLAEEGAGGVLERAGGLLYLVDGRVVHAESEAATPLGRLVVGAGRLTEAQWAEALERCGGDSGRAAALLVKDGRLADGALELCRHTALFDAACFALAPGGGAARFRHGVAPEGGLALSVPADRVLAETARRRRLLASLWPGAAMDTQPVLRRTPGPDRPVPSRLRALLDLADGVRTPAELARALGRPAFHVLVEVRRLAIAGLVEPPGPRARQPTAARTGRSPAARSRAPDGFESPDIALLQRVRDALEACL